MCAQFMIPSHEGCLVMLPSILSGSEEASLWSSRWLSQQLSCWVAVRRLPILVDSLKRIVMNSWGSSKVVISMCEQLWFLLLPWWAIHRICDQKFLLFILVVPCASSSWRFECGSGRLEFIESRDSLVIVLIHASWFSGVSSRLALGCSSSHVGFQLGLFWLSRDTRILILVLGSGASGLLPCALPMIILRYGHNLLLFGFGIWRLRVDVRIPILLITSPAIH